MKRSRSIRLALLGTASLLSLAACDQAEDPLADGQFYADAQACEAGQSGSQNSAAQNATDCKASFAQAQEEHAKSAPKFTSREACEAEFGAANCVSTPGEGGSTVHAGGGWFMPAMLGFMAGRMMSGGGYRSMPVYRDTNNTAYTGRQPLGQINASRMAPPQRVAGTMGAPAWAPSRTGTADASRGGFGRSGYSSSSSS